MNEEKIRKTVYELTQNARIRTKELGTQARISQQSASYILQSLEKQHLIIGRSTIIDSAKFGYVNVLVYCNYTTFDSQRQKEIIQYLQEQDQVVMIEEIKQGYDLKVWFGVPNLSSFNKTKRAFLQNCKDKIIVMETFPVVVKHIYPRKYLISKKIFSEKVIAGDRDVIDINPLEMKVLKDLWVNPNHSIVEISQTTALNPKTIVKIKKNMQEKKIVRGYTAFFDLEKLGITKQYLLFSSEDLSLEEDAKLLHFCFIHPQVISLTKLIGTYDLLIETESDERTKKDVLKDFRTEFGFKKYKVLQGGRIIKDTYLPKSALE